ncbi:MULTISPECIES: hypothetical protein [Citrobacter]|uniref:Uncharacterized protein n=1 Tax=Citrobacter portucalensis TaxID=1639133 RepID=A0AAJ1NBW0_9ENTR|nr:MULTISPECIES: hypothetical protein [Citrobacter]MCE9794672.1 hypothetical protein [Citrobacter portucalensis]MCR3696627.1 hypothetical protein [Citrobacter portucalensis]MDE9625162.1 hypothetical protein [Citrobacter portucalensis]MDE9680780.1 hypothetical protein [Citrobacter portucalensis]MDG9958714.1 hypothetical protein [Citrobacter portucalensis]
MSTYQPPFVVTPLILIQVIEIGELMGHWAAMAGRASPLYLCFAGGIGKTISLVGRNVG